MDIENAIMLLQHTGCDDFNLEEHQIIGRLQAIECIINELKKKQEVIDRLANIIYEIDDCRKSAGGYPSDYIDKLVCILNDDKEVE